MKKRFFFWFILILGIIILPVIVFNNKKENNSSYVVNKTSGKVNNSNYISNNSSGEINNQTDQLNESQNSSNVTNITINSTGDEIKNDELISTFSTKIYTKDEGRQNNVTITCNKLNGTIVKNNSTFSFCDTIGPSTSSKGYKEAEIFDDKGNKKPGLGGGNCQVSTTLYNAVLKVPSLIVTERHQHSNKVPYIQEGKDAAVAYGNFDLNFKNNSGFDIKIEAITTNDNITVNLYKTL